MAVNAFGMESGANLDTLSPANTGSDSIQHTGGTTFQISTTQKAHGTRSAYYVGTTAAGGLYMQKTISGTAVAARAYFYWTGLPSGDTTVIWFGNGSSQRAHVEVTSTGAVRFRDDANAAQWNGSVTTSVGTMGTAGWYRVEFRADMSAQTARLAVYSLDSSTPVTNMDSGARTAVNTGADSFTNFRVGGKAASNVVTFTGVYVDDWAVNDATSTFMGAYTETLATPTVTLGTTTHPSTVGGSNGAQRVSWGTVAGATSYDAYKANGSSPSQGDFTLVASGVTSPYDFGSLAAGTYSYGIMAKA